MQNAYVFHIFLLNWKYEENPSLRPTKIMPALVFVCLVTSLYKERFRTLYDLLFS